MPFNIVIFTHYPVLYSQSMPRFAGLIANGMRERGYNVNLWTSPVWIGLLGKRLPFLQKWLGYIDQFLIFPFIVRWRLRKCSPDTLFVFSDQALGPWVPLIAKYPHIIHCHDFLALRSAQGEFPTDHRLSFSGRLYQHFIRWGFQQGRCFISVSAATQTDLHRFLPHPPQLSTVVHNPLNSPFAPQTEDQARAILGPLLPSLLEQPYIIHIGNNWYKNRVGVFQIFEQLTLHSPYVQLVMVSKPNQDLKNWLRAHPLLEKQIHFLQGVSFEQLQALYSLAQALVYPSLYEGFGWPVLEALACGCPVLTTNAPPMTEVAAETAFYLSTYPENPTAQTDWAKQGAESLLQIFNLSLSEKQALKAKGLAQASRFTLESTLDDYENFYLEAMKLL